MEQDEKVKEYTEEQKSELYGLLDNTSKLLNNSMSLILYKSKERQKNMDKYIKTKSIEEKISEETALVKQAILLLKTWYNKSKKEEINKLQDKINQVLSEFFENKYNLELKQTVERGNNVVHLVSVGSGGKPISTMDITLSGAEQQMSGFLIQAAVTNMSDGGIIILDEAFSSFGVKEVARIPKLLTTIDKQILIIEHKNELFEDFPVLTYELDNDVIKGTHVKEVIRAEDM